MDKITSFSGDYRFLSNFALGGVVQYDGIFYKTVEHAYQAAKTVDEAERRRIHVAKHPGEAKKVGKKLTLRPNWDEIKLDIMLDLLKQKFSVGEFRIKLIDTGDAELIEGNTWHDNYWGDCVCSKPKCDDLGRNWLGKLLMQVRKELRNA
jgi:ribA/ribD-fused uncharacterized protein